MPCLNEENTVGLCVKEALAFLQKHPISGEVLVVDNGSEDGSAAAAETLSVIDDKSAGVAGRVCRSSGFFQDGKAFPQRAEKFQGTEPPPPPHASYICRSI